VAAEAAVEVAVAVAEEAAAVVGEEVAAGVEAEEEAAGEEVGVAGLAEAAEEEAAGAVVEAAGPAEEAAEGRAAEAEEARRSCRSARRQPWTSRLRSRPSRPPGTATRYRAWRGGRRRDARRGQTRSGRACSAAR